MKQTILGAGGAIGTELAKSLIQFTNDIRLVSRNPKKVNPNDELFSADLTQKDQVAKAIAGSEVVYVTVGFEYNTKIWQKLWVPLMKNVIDACLINKTKLVFFDNVYAIGGDHIKHITETPPISPTSKKGQVRAEVDKLIIEAAEKRSLEAIIARAPDFFSEYKDRSLLMNLVYDNLVKGRKAQWFCNAKVIHTTGYAPDLAKGTAILGNTKDAYNQIWNLPTDPEKITGEQWIKLFADEMNATDKYQVLPAWGMRLLGVFVPILREMHEMCYQYDRDYYFDSSKFNSTFRFVPTANRIAVKQTIERLKQSTSS